MGNIAWLRPAGRSLSTVGLFSGLTLAAFASRSQDPLLFYVLVHLYILPIVAAGYFLSRGTALIFALAPITLFIPLLAKLATEMGFDSAVSELGLLLLFFLVLGLLIPIQREHERMQRKIGGMLDRMGKLIEKSSELDRLLPLILEQGIELVDADGGRIFQGRTREAESISRRAKPGDGSSRHPDPPHPGTSLGDWLAGTDGPTLIPDLSEDARLGGVDSTQKGLALIAVPLRRSQQPFGALVLWRVGRRFSRQEADLLRIFADKAEMAIENAWLHRRTDAALASQTYQRALLIEASAEFSSTHNAEELANKIARKMIDLVGATTCRISLLSDGRALVGAAARTRRAVDWDPSLGRPFAPDILPHHQSAIRDAKPLVLRADSEGQSEPERSLLFPAGARSALLMPIAARGKPVGVASLAEMRSPERSAFSGEKVELCWALARLGGLALENIRAFETLSYESQRTRLIIDNVADGVLTAGLDGRILAFNHAAERITDFAAEAVSGRRCSDVLNGIDEYGRSLCDQGCPLTGSSPWKELDPVWRKEWVSSKGSRVLVAQSLAPLLDPAGRVTGTVAVFRDISREEELARMKSDFIAMASHQLRSPLAYIAGSAELLSSPALDEDSRNQMLEMLQSQCSRLTRLVNQVLSATRLEKGTIKLTPEPVALLPIVEQTIRFHRAQYPSHDFRIDCLARSPFAYGDRNSVEVVIDNLLQNAVKYSPEGTTVKISVAEEPDTLRVSVADEGFGIPADKLGQVFERYFRVSELNSKADGFGLGLYIARLLVEAQGGRIWVDSLPGLGASFHFTLSKIEVDDEQNTLD